MAVEHDEISKVYTNTTFSKGQKWSFGLGSLAQYFLSGSFNAWVLTFYFSAVQLPMRYIIIAYICWTIWNAFNDPLLGYLSDRTSTRWGRRKPFIVFGSIPIVIIEIVIWLPRPGNDIVNFLFLLATLLCYDTFYTMISLPFDALFPELYTSVKERAEVNRIRQVLGTIGLFIGFTLPGFVIGDTVSNPDGYLTFGIISSIMLGVSLFISIKFGVKERKEFKFDTSKELGFIRSLKYTLKNWNFVLYTIMFFMFEYMLLVLGSTVPLYGEEVLNAEPFETSLLSGTLFLVGVLSVVLIWEPLDKKWGSRKGFGVALLAYLIAIIPFLFITQYISALIVAAAMGIGFGGVQYFIYLIIVDVIDEDELKTGIRREGSFFGVTNFFMRLSMIASVVTIGSMFISTGWDSWVPNPAVDVLLALRLLLVLYPGIAIIISLVCLYFFPYTKAKINGIKSELAILHEKKRLKVSESDV